MAGNVGVVYPRVSCRFGERIQSIKNDESLATTLSLAALHNLENGKEAQAKFSLANHLTTLA